MGMGNDLQNDLFGSAQIAGTDLRAFAQKEVRKKTNPIPQGICASSAQNRSIELRGFARERHPLGLFGGVDALAELEVEERMLVEALTELNMELTALNSLLAPWFEKQRATAERHAEIVEAQGFKLGGEQADWRREKVKALDELRRELSGVFSAAGEVRNTIRSNENKLRSVIAEIRIIKARKKRRAGRGG